ncbi:hypothetical protein [Tuwongella immobilis]|uniref:Uncharacterized protein n=1 Tax=Tuwongella immobilis TaxID=692036 RepID=A0A6C2YN77_9BACT|nr:hypothetical protein [Tuwongella immobilis]VIP03070.1 unnamed protein product [Tuwongella immobilis]VTS03297.1 unnamed protein product [Tuwongella immobilis]
MPLNPTNNWKVWANREPVTLVSVNRVEDTSWLLVDCKRRAIGYRELSASAGIYTGMDLVWLIPRVKLPDGIQPKLADRIVDSTGVAWTVLEAALNTWQSWWRLVTRNLVLVHQLRDTIALIRPTNRPDHAGGRVAEPTVLVANIPARIQLVAEESITRHGRLSMRRQYTAIIGQPLRTAPTDLVRDENGITYQVLSASNADRIDTLMELTLERID